MRTAVVLALCAFALAACKKSPRPTVSAFPDTTPLASGGNIELPEAVVFHVILRSMDHAGPILRYYETELQKRGAHRAGDVITDDNMTHDGTAFSMDSSAAPKDPSRPGVWLSVMETGNETRIDIWESVPRSK
jgi:hypothetical protein